LTTEKGVLVSNHWSN